MEEFFEALIALARSFDEEERRVVSEDLSEEELALFDLLTRPSPELSDKERVEVKKAARALLATLKQRALVLDWRKRQQARADVRTTIERALDDALPRSYTPELYEEKCALVYDHVYESYSGPDQSVYTTAA